MKAILLALLALLFGAGIALFDAYSADTSKKPPRPKPQYCVPCGNGQQCCWDS